MQPKNGRRIILAALFFLLMFAFPGICWSDPHCESCYEEGGDYETGALMDSSMFMGEFMKSGFSLTAGVGYQFVPFDSVSSGSRYFQASAMGALVSVDIGYHFEFFTLSFNISPRAAWLYKDSIVQDKHHKYSALDKGAWDGYFASLGLKFDFAIRMSDVLLMSLGFGFEVPVGVAVTRDVAEFAFRFSGNIGIYTLMSEHLALGFKMQIGGDFDWEDAREDGLTVMNYHASLSLEPMFSLIYHP